MPLMPGIRRSVSTRSICSLLEALERLLAALGGDRLDAHLLEQDLQDAAHLALVVDHQDLLHAVSPRDRQLDPEGRARGRPRSRP